VAAIWRPLIEEYGIHIDFAWRTFIWDSEASDMAHVHVVVIGFSSGNQNIQPFIMENGVGAPAAHINPYLYDAPDVFIEARRKPICDVPQMVYGNKPADGGYLFLSKDEKEELLAREPGALPLVRQIYGAEEFINRKPRYCLWLVGTDPSLLRRLPMVQERIQGVRAFRSQSTKTATRAGANTPTLFMEIRQPDSDYIIVPLHTSQSRHYVPLGFVGPEVLVNNAVSIIPDATLYEFGILTSQFHNAWMRTVAGRLKSDYRYSNSIVYNNFVWPDTTDVHKAEIADLAQAVLDARAHYPTSSLADLYDPLTMPPDLLKAHNALDCAVERAYGVNFKGDEERIVAYLFGLYAERANSASGKQQST
jgi:hypothetical protein